MVEAFPLSPNGNSNPARRANRLLNTVGWFRRIGEALLVARRSLAGVASLAWMGIIWWTSSFSPPPAPRQYGWRSVAQNFLHAPAYGFLALLFILALPRRGKWPQFTRAEQVLVVLGALSYGIVDELHQSQVPNRDLSVLDLASDITAPICVLIIISYLGRAGATESGLARRFVLGLLACLACATAAAYAPRFFPEIAWF